MWLYVCAVVAAVHLRAPARQDPLDEEGPEVRPPSGPKPAQLKEVFSARWTACVENCRAHPEAGDFKDEHQCREDCLESKVVVNTDLGADPWIEAADHDKEKEYAAGKAERFGGFWDFLCEGGIEAGCRSVAEVVAEKWLKIEAASNITLEVGRQYLIHQNADDDQAYDAAFAAFTERHREEMKLEQKALLMDGSIYVGQYMNATGGTDAAAAATELETLATELSPALRIHMLKQRAEEKSDKQLTGDREALDAAYNKAVKDMANSKLDDAVREARQAQLDANLAANHTTAHEEHIARVREAFGKIMPPETPTE